MVAHRVVTMVAHLVAMAHLLRVIQTGVHLVDIIMETRAEWKETV
jgi:hypothetical protein